MSLPKNKYSSMKPKIQKYRCQSCFSDRVIRTTKVTMVCVDCNARTTLRIA